MYQVNSRNRKPGRLRCEDQSGNGLVAGYDGLYPNDALYCQSPCYPRRHYDTRGAVWRILPDSSSAIYRFHTRRSLGEQSGATAVVLAIKVAYTMS